MDCIGIPIPLGDFPGHRLLWLYVPRSEYGMLIGWVVVWLCIQKQVGVGGFPVHPVPQGAMRPSVYANIQKGKMAVGLSLHGELNVGMDVVEVVDKVLQLFGSMGPDHKCVIHVMEPTCGHEGHPAESHLLKIFHEEAGNDG